MWPLDIFAGFASRDLFALPHWCSHQLFSLDVERSIYAVPTTTTTMTTTAKLLFLMWIEMLLSRELKKKINETQPHIIASTVSLTRQWNTESEKNIFNFVISTELNEEYQLWLFEKSEKWNEKEVVSERTANGPTDRNREKINFVDSVCLDMSGRANGGQDTHTQKKCASFSLPNGKSIERLIVQSQTDANSYM